MIKQALALYNWDLGVILIGVFALVCVALVAILISFIMSGKKKTNEES